MFWHAFVVLAAGGARDPMFSANDQRQCHLELLPESESPLLLSIRTKLITLVNQARLDR